ncbi:MAG: Cna B-type domain-containing protein [Clostridia bacterium]|nr:Cna B-type domain-containing protein [Clostridia bacterium]
MTDNKTKVKNRKKTGNGKTSGRFTVIVLYGMLLLLMVVLSSRIRPQIFLASAEQEVSSSDTDGTDAEDGETTDEFWAGDAYSDMDVLVRGEATIPVTQFQGPGRMLLPQATGVLTHSTSMNETILLSDLLKELGLATDENKLEAASGVTSISGSDQLFTVTKLENGDWKITTKRSFDTLEPVTLTDAEGDLSVIFKDSLYTTNLNELNTNVQLTVNGKTYNADNVWGEETIYVSPKKLYELELTFTERPDKQFSNFEEMEYTLPQGYILPQNFNEMGYSLSISMDIGGVLKDNPVRTDESRTKLYIRWNQEDQEKFNYFRRSSVATFTLNLSGNLDLQNGKFIFSANKELKLRQENLHNAIVKKSVTYIPYRMMYEIRVTSDGTTENLLLTDEMGRALKAPDDVTMFFAENRHLDDNEYKPVLHPMEDGRMVISIPKMDDEDELIIQYSSEVDINKIQVSGKATMEETGNTATVTGDEDPSDNVEVAYVPGVRFSDMVKEGTGKGNIATEDGRFGLVEWKVDMNREVDVSLAGSDFTDYMGEEHMEESMYYGEGIHVVCTDKDGNVCATRLIPWEDLGVDTATAKSWTYHIPEDDDKYRYTIDYQSIVSLTGKDQDFLVDNYVIGKCGETKAEVMIHPKGPGNVGVYKFPTNIKSDQVTWQYNLTVKESALDEPLMMMDYQGDTKGALPRMWISDYEKDGVTYSGRYYQESVRSIEVIGLLPGETVEILHEYKKDTPPGTAWPTTTHSQTFTKTADGTSGGVLVFSDFEASSDLTPSPKNNIFIRFYKDADKTPGLQEPEDGSGSRQIVVKMTNHFPLEWANAVDDYNAFRGSYRPFMFDHNNYVEFSAGPDAALDSGYFTSMPVSVYKQLMMDGTSTDNAGSYNPIDAEGNIYPVYRFRVAVNGVTTDDPLVIEDAFDTDLFKLFDMRDFGGAQSAVEQTANGVHKISWINWIKPSFAGQSDITWNTASSDLGPVYSTSEKKCNDQIFVDDTGKQRRVIGDANVLVEETDTGARFTFRNMNTFKKANGEHQNYYVVEYYLVPKDIQALAKLENRIREAREENPNTSQTTFTNTASCRNKEVNASAPYRSKNNLFPVTKEYMRDGSSSSVQHPRLKFSIKLNPARMKLNEGRDMIATDEYSSSLSIDFTTLKIETNPPEAKELVAYDFSGNVGSYTIPDETYVHITYTATIIGEPEEGQETVAFSNRVTVGDYSAAVEDDVKVTFNTNGTAIIPQIYIFKYCSNHMERGLKGAVFELLDENKNPIYDGFTHEPIQRTTDENGRILLNINSIDNGIDMITDTYYHIHEVSAPEGYTPSNTYYKFKISSDGRVNYDKDHYAYLSGDTLTVRNTPKSIGFKLDKTIESNIVLSDDELNGIKFTLEKKVGDQWVVYTVPDPDSDNGVISYRNIPFPSLALDPIPASPATGEGEGEENKDGKQQPALTGHYRFTGLTPGDYRLVETGNDAILEHHSNTHFTLHYEFTDRSSGNTSPMQFTVTEDDLWYANDKKVTVTNNYVTETIEKKVRKKWTEPDGTEINWPEGLTVKLQIFSRRLKTVEEGGGNGEILDTPINTIVLDGKPDNSGEKTAGTATFSGLPRYDSVTHQNAVYYVKELTSFRGYTTQQPEYLLSDDSFTLVNKKTNTGSLSVIKTWPKSFPDDAYAEFKLFAYEEDAGIASAVPVQTKRVEAESAVNLSPEDDDLVTWEVRFENLNNVSDRDVPLIYFVRESDCTFPYVAEYPGETPVACNGETIANQIASVDFSVIKQWKDTPGNTWPENLSITLHLKRSHAQSGNPDGSFDRGFTLTNGSFVSTAENDCEIQKLNGGRYQLTVNGLEKYAPDGTAWVYYIEEQPVDGYTTQYTDRNHSDRTDSGNATNGGFIINQMELHSLTLKKKVSGSMASRWRSFDFSVNVTDKEGNLLSGTVPVEIRHLSGDTEFVNVNFTQGKGTVSLRHGDVALFEKLPAGAAFSVSEEDTGADYTVSVKMDGVSCDQAAGTLTRDRTVEFLNERNSVIPTGAEAGILVSLVLLAIAGSSLILTLSLRRQREKRPY